MTKQSSNWFHNKKIKILIFFKRPPFAAACQVWLPLGQKRGVDDRLPDDPNFHKTKFDLVNFVFYWFFKVNSRKISHSWLINTPLFNIVQNFNTLFALPKKYTLIFFINNFLKNCWWETAYMHWMTIICRTMLIFATKLGHLFN